MQTTAPPCITVTRHYLPIVCWEAPVLAIGSKHIGRCTGRDREVKLLAVAPHIHSVGSNADGDIAFEGNTTAICIVMGIGELCKEKILYIAVEMHLLYCIGILGNDTLFGGVVVVRIVAPIPDVAVQTR